MIYLTLFWEFFKIGLFSIGGGPATIPFLIDLSSKYPQWYSVQELADMIAVSQSTPGPIGINMATYVGNTVASVFGGVCTTFGEVLPAIIIISLISHYLMQFKEKPFVKDMMIVIRPVALGLMSYALLCLVQISLFNQNTHKILWINTIAFIVFYGFMNKYKKLHPLIWIGIGAIFGIIFL